jgi:CBS domain-containing protein
LIFGFVGLFSNPFLIFIAFFVWIGAAQELGAAQMRSALDNVPVTRAMLTKFHTLHPDDRLSRAIELTLNGSQRDFPVTEGGRVVGILTQDRLMKSLSSGGESILVRDVMSGTFGTAESNQTLESALEIVSLGKDPVVPVLDGGRLVGILTIQNVVEFMGIREALHHSPGTGAVEKRRGRTDRRVLPSREVHEAI